MKNILALLIATCISFLCVGHAAVIPDADILAPRAPTLPQDDPFYTVPANVGTYQPGQIIRSRPVPNSLAAFGTIPVNIQAAYQLLYRTTNSKGNATATVTTVLIPHNADFSKLLSYQIEYDSPWTGCNPSYALQEGAPVELLGQYSLLLYSAALDQGWVVSTPDYEGPEAAFSAGLISGRATLDGVRAVLHSENITGVSPDAEYAMWGYSGGSLASEWAAELQPTYAPELNFIGAVLGGLTPNVTSIDYTINEGVFAGFFPSGLIGLANDYPELQAFINEQLLPSKAAAWNKVKSQCIVDDATQFAFQDMFTYFADGTGILDSPVTQAVILDGGIMGRHGVPKMPIYAYKAVQDEISPIADTDALISKLCGEGAQIEYVRDELAEHISEAAFGSAGALRFLLDRFAGTPAQPGCSNTTVATQTLDPANAPLYGEIIFDDLLALLGQPVGPPSIGSI